MPLYLYETVGGGPATRFLVQQAMADPPLAVHPDSGAAVFRVLCPPAIGARSAQGRADRTLQSDSKLEGLGFTKYVKSGDGTYEKTAGTGPRVIDRGGSPLSD